MVTTQSTGAEYALGGRLTDAALLKTWGAVVTAGWVVSQAVAVLELSPFALTAFWFVGSLVPIGASFLWMRARGFTGLFPTWTVLGVTGLAASAAVLLELVALPLVYVFGALWFAGPAVGFLVTAWYMDDWSGRLYGAAALANVVGAVAVVGVPGFESVYFTYAAVVQGLPMLYHGVQL